jgi:hypothetical protein
MKHLLHIRAVIGSTLTLGKGEVLDNHSNKSIRHRSSPSCEPDRQLTGAINRYMPVFVELNETFCDVCSATVTPKTMSVEQGLGARIVTSS